MKSITDLKNSKISEKKQKIKKFRSAYILFTSVRRLELKKIHTNLPNQELIKIIADEWKHLDEVTRQKYKQLEQEDIQRFEKEKEIVGDYHYTTSPKNKKPLRFRTAFMFFLRHHKKILQSKEKYQNIELIKTLSKYWKNMNENEKKNFEDMAIGDKERYRTEWEKYLIDCFTVKDKVNKKKERIQSVITTLFKTCSNKNEFQNHLNDIYEKITDIKPTNIEEQMNNNTNNNILREEELGDRVIDGKGFTRKKVVRKNMIFEITKTRANFNNSRSHIRQPEEKAEINKDDFNRKQQYFFKLDDAVDAQLSDFKVIQNFNFGKSDFSKEKKTQQVIQNDDHVLTESDEESFCTESLEEEFNNKKQQSKKRKREAKSKSKPLGKNKI